jgi:hypothetical protein
VTKRERNRERETEIYIYKQVIEERGEREKVIKDEKGKEKGY